MRVLALLFAAVAGPGGAPASVQAVNFPGSLNEVATSPFYQHVGDNRCNGIDKNYVMMDYSREDRLKIRSADDCMNHCISSTKGDDGFLGFESGYAPGEHVCSCYFFPTPAKSDYPDDTQPAIIDVWNWPQAGRANGNPIIVDGGPWNQYKCYRYLGGALGTDEPTSGPTGAPTPAPISAPWAIDFLGIASDFSVSSDKEIVMTYEIGKDRAFETFLYQKDCASDIEGITVDTTEARTDINATHDLLTVSHSVDKSAIADSSVWNPTENKIEICQVVNLFLPGPPKLVISEDIREVDVDFDLSVNYTTESDLGAGTIEDAVGQTNVSSYVTACKCKSPSNFTCNPEPLVPNTQLYVCIKSVSTDVEVKQLKSMVVEQGDADMGVVADGQVQISSIASMDYVEAENGVVVATFVPTNIFAYTAGASINITGGIDMELANSTRRLLAGTDGGALGADDGQEFALEVELREGAIVLEGEGEWVDSSGALLDGASALLGMTLLVAYGVW